MKGVPHLVLSHVPLKRGSDIEVLCGRTIRNAQWVFEEVVEGDIKYLAQMTMRMCQECTRRFFLMDSEKFAELDYVYGCLAAVEMKLTDWQEAS